jgi:hypothetical protein
MTERASYSRLLENTLPPPADIQTDDLAVLLYTSGTTGNPKGCMASHYYFVNLADMQARLFDLRAEDRVYTAQPFYYMDPHGMLATRNALALGEIQYQQVLDEVSGIDHLFYCIGSMTSFLFNMPPSESDKTHNLRMVQTSECLHGCMRHGSNDLTYRSRSMHHQTACDIAVHTRGSNRIGLHRPPGLLQGGQDNGR